MKIFRLLLVFSLFFYNFNLICADTSSSASKSNQAGPVELLQMVQEFADKGLDINQVIALLTTITKKPKLELILASKDNNLELVNFILEKGMDDINQKDDSGNTALFYAISNQNSAIVEVLLKNGTDISSKDLEEVIKSLSVEIFQLIVEYKGIDVFNDIEIREYGRVQSGLKAISYLLWGVVDFCPKFIKGCAIGASNCPTPSQEPAAKKRLKKIICGIIKPLRQIDAYDALLDKKIIQNMSDDCLIPITQSRDSSETLHGSIFNFIAQEC